MFKIILNGSEMEFRTEKEMIGTLYTIPLLNLNIVPLTAIKDKVKVAGLLVCEYCDMNLDRLSKLPKAQDTETKKKRISEKTRLSKLKTRVITLTQSCKGRKTKDSLASTIYNFKLSLEGLGLLTGFQYTKKKYKERPKGNAELTSITELIS